MSRPLKWVVRPRCLIKNSSGCEFMSDPPQKQRGVPILGISLALLNLLLWFCVPAIRGFVDETTGRWANADNPRVMNGVQELLVFSHKALRLTAKRTGRSVNAVRQKREVVRRSAL